MKKNNIIKEEIEEEEGGVRRREKKMGSENKQTNKHPFFLPRRNWKPPEDEIVYNLLQLLIVGLPTILPQKTRKYKMLFLERYSNEFGLFLIYKSVTFADRCLHMFLIFL